MSPHPQPTQTHPTSSFLSSLDPQKEIMCTLTCMSMHDIHGHALMNNLLKWGEIIDLICYKKEALRK